LMLERLDLEGLAGRYPFQLSGGQQQRVAIARSLAYEPHLLLLDEPLSNLDAQLREKARAWLKEIHEKFGLTIILVTHDQSEALSLSSTIVLLNKGKIEQVGAADEIYERPVSAYAAEFVGGANVIAGRVSAVSGDTGQAEITTAAGVKVLARLQEGMTLGEEVGVAIRPQKILLGRGQKAQTGTRVTMEVGTVLYQGTYCEVLGGTPLGPIRMFADRAPEGKSVEIFLPQNECLCVRL
jgi:iron(III) transport system ATP-binding protein